MASVCWDQKMSSTSEKIAAAATHSVNTGIPLAIARGSSRISKDVRVLANIVGAGLEPKAEPKAK